jgi:hypothetical protein
MPQLQGYLGVHSLVSGKTNSPAVAQYSLSRSSISNLNGLLVMAIDDKKDYSIKIETIISLVLASLELFFVARSA